MIESVIYADFKTIKSDCAYDGYYITDGVNYILYTGDRFSIYMVIVKPGSNKTDFDNNHKSSYTSITSEGLAMSRIQSGLHHVFDSEALASGVYEGSEVVGCDGPNKTFNIKNEHATNGLYYKVWGSPDNSEWEEIIGETSLAALSRVSVTNNDMWKYVKVSAKGAGGASTVDAFVQVGI